MTQRGYPLTRGRVWQLERSALCKMRNELADLFELVESAPSSTVLPTPKRKKQIPSGFQRRSKALTR